jgi:hypothetical protein
MNKAIKILFILLIVQFIAIIYTNIKSSEFGLEVVGENKSTLNTCRKLTKIDNKYIYYISRLFYLNNGSYYIENKNEIKISKILLRVIIPQNEEINLKVNNSINRIGIKYNYEFGEYREINYYPDTSLINFRLKNTNDHEINLDQLFIEYNDENSICIDDKFQELNTIDKIKNIIVNHNIYVLFVLLLLAFIYNNYQLINDFIHDSLENIINIRFTLLFIFTFILIILVLEYQGLLKYLLCLIVYKVNERYSKIQTDAFKLSIIYSLLLTMSVNGELEVIGTIVMIPILLNWLYYESHKKK